MRQTQIILSLSLLFALNACKQAPKETAVEESKRKIVTIGGTITEIVYALGEGDAIIAVDKTSTYPEAVKQLTNIGYRNSIKAEGIISLAPDLLLAEEEYMNADIYTQLESTGIQFKTFTSSTSIDSTISLIKNIAAYLDKSAQGDSLIAILQEDRTKLNDLLAQTENKPKVLFVYARGPETISIAGTGTFAESIIPLAGGQMAIADAEGFKPLTSEALVTSNPDYLLIFESGLQSLGGVEGALKIKGLELTTAGKEKNIIALDGLYISGFGPRAAKAAYELAQKIHPELTITQ